MQDDPYAINSFNKAKPEQQSLKELSNSQGKSFKNEIDDKKVNSASVNKQ